MRTIYKRELDHNYLILQQEEFRDHYQVGMLISNKIPGLLECALSRIDKEAGFYYEITSRQNLRLVLERRHLKAAELHALLEQLLLTARSCEEHLLDTEQLLLNPDYIYLDPDRWEFSFCFFPFYDAAGENELLKLSEYLLDRLDKQDADAVALGYEFYRMAGEENASLEQVLSKWKEENGSRKETEAFETKTKTGTETEKEAPQSAGRGETIFLKKASGLTLRSENPAYSSMEITADNFLIGKKKDAVDGWIKARGISRIHGKISKEDGIYYLMDLNSTNGTFLNGGRLEVNEKARIRQGDVVGFADVKYVVDLSGDLLYNKKDIENMAC
jgi:FOG: FHA domain